MELNSKSFIVSAAGGVINYVDGDGEVLFSVHVPAGKVPVAEYLELAPEGAQMVPATPGMTIVSPRSRIAIQHMETQEHSGANPDFQPSSADLMQRQLRLQVAQMQAAQRTLEARMALLGTIERMPTAPTEAATPTTPTEPASPVVD